MNPRIAITVLIAAMAGSLAGCATDPNKSTSQNVRESVSDTVITGKIKAEYARDKEVSALNISVDTDNKGVVTLSGSAKSQAEANKAVAIARSVSGVSSVRNNIRVQAAQ